MIRSKSNIITLTHEPLDSKIANFRVDENNVIIESISDYLIRNKFGIRIPGVIIAIIINPDNPDTITIPISSLDETLRNYTNKYYAFIGGIRDIDFKEIVIVGGGGTVEDGKSAYEIAVENGFEGTESEWLESLKGDKGDPGDAIPPLTRYSVQGNGTDLDQIQLVNDSATPGTKKYYGTDEIGARGFHSVPETGSNTWIGLNDTIPESFNTKAKHVPMVNDSENALDLTPTQELETILAKLTVLADCPNTLVGHGGKYLKVKIDETGIEFVS